MSRNARSTMANETLQALKQGYYITSEGQTIAIRDALATSVAQTRVIAPEDWPVIVESGRATPRQPRSASVMVTPETTLQAARRLVTVEGRCTVLALNFASAKNPGGGFLSGSQAQEESLARASGLYTTLLAGEPYYTANRACPSKLYTDHAILSPQVPVFRDDDGTLLTQPYSVSFLTMPAPNRGAIEPGSQDLRDIRTVLDRRVSYVLALAAGTGHRCLILGAWGCGVFRNNPAEVADAFAQALLGTQGWAAWFQHVCLAVFDPSADRHVRTAFERRFAQSSSAQEGV
jgi:uncharacterized protein (TIGR02452 family)